ncbi:hypothetical protein N431DRAFT_536050 [Stipitochalara longipes BDJ]|nr:hypothetical protein N431DRAFT_536050 [Stipitochalara longipes BDJ]
MACNAGNLPIEDFTEDSRAFHDPTPQLLDLNFPKVTDASKTTRNKPDQVEVNITSKESTTKTTTASVQGSESFPIIINGKSPTKSSTNLTKLEKLPILNEVIVRSTKLFKADVKRISREEGWAATERGTIAEKACYECSKGRGPFTLCCVIEGMFKGACGNCQYGGNASRCSFYRDYQNAVACLIAKEVKAPIIPGMAPANYTGGSIANGGFTLNGPAGAPLLQHVPIPQQFIATPGVARGSHGQRIVPTPAPQFGFGSTDVSRLAHARSLTPDERKATADRLKAELIALEKAMGEDNVSNVTEQGIEPKGTKRKQNEMNEH